MSKPQLMHDAARQCPRYNGGRGAADRIPDEVDLARWILEHTSCWSCRRVAEIVIRDAEAE